MWKKKIRDIVKRAVDNGNLNIVLSPDVDGIVSTVILAKYAREVHDAETNVIGTYDSEALRMAGEYGPADAKKALWVDLDVRFDVPYVIGQHFLGKSNIGDTYFNPNIEMGVTSNMFEKCPISTTHLLLWSLYENEGDMCDNLAGEDVTCARAAVAHADSLYIIAKKYNRNVWRWARMLFMTNADADSDDVELPQTLKMLLGNTYNKNGLDAHHEFLCSIVPHIACKGMPKKTWMDFRRHQSVKRNGHMQHVKALLRTVAAHFGVGAPRMEDGERVVWRGRRAMWDADKYNWASGEFEAQLASAKVMSHAIVNRKTISVTLGKPLVVEKRKRNEEGVHPLVKRAKN